MLLQCIRPKMKTPVEQLHDAASTRDVKKWEQLSKKKSSSRSLMRILAIQNCLSCVKMHHSQTSLGISLVFLQYKASFFVMLRKFVMQNLQVSDCDKLFSLHNSSSSCSTGCSCCTSVEQIPRNFASCVEFRRDLIIQEKTPITMHFLHDKHRILCMFCMTNWMGMGLFLSILMRIVVEIAFFLCELIVVFVPDDKLWVSDADLFLF